MSLPNDPIEIQLRSSLSDGSPVAADEAKWQMIEGRIVHADSRRRGMVAGGATMVMAMAIAGAIVVSSQAGSRVNPAASSYTGIATTTLTNSEANGLGVTNASLALAGSGIPQTNSLTKLEPKILPPGYIFTEAHASLINNYPQLPSTTEGSQYFADPNQPPESTPVLAISVLPQRTLDLIGDKVPLAQGDGRLAKAKDHTKLQMLRNNGTSVVNLTTSNIDTATVTKIADSIVVNNTDTGPTVGLPGGLMASLNLVRNTAIAEQRQIKDSWALLYTNPAVAGSNFGVSAVPGTDTDLAAQILEARISDGYATIAKLSNLNAQRWPANQLGYIVGDANDVIVITTSRRNRRIGSSGFGTPAMNEPITIRNAPAITARIVPEILKPAMSSSFLIGVTRYPS